jgi:hypothetical protein
MEQLSCSRLQEIFEKFFASKITQKELDRLLSHYTPLYRMKYKSLSEEDIQGSILEALVQFKKAPITNSLKKINLAGYFSETLNNAFSNEFRKLPDANLFSRIKGVLKDKKAAYRRPFHNGDAKTNWVLDSWQPANWKENVSCISDQELLELDAQASSMEELQITVIEQAEDSKKDSCLVHTGDIQKYIDHLFELSKSIFIGGRSLRATDLKQIVCNKLWMIPVYPASYLYETSVDGEEDEDLRPWEKIPDEKKEFSGSMDLTNLLRESIERNRKDYKLWLLFKMAENPESSLSELVEEQNFSPGIKKLQKSAIDNKKKELLEFITMNHINLEEQGARDIILTILGNHFERNSNVEYGVT